MKSLAALEAKYPISKIAQAKVSFGQANPQVAQAIKPLLDNLPALQNLARLLSSLSQHSQSIEEIASSNSSTPEQTTARLEALNILSQDLSSLSKALPSYSKVSQVCLASTEATLKLLMK